MTATITGFLRDATSALGEAGIQSPEIDAELLIGHVLGLSRGEVQARSITGGMLTDELVERLGKMVERRAAREPLQHITGRAYFRSLELAVGPGVFVPRPETEQVAQFAIDALRVVASAAPIGVDLGTGSGAIAFAMATEVPHAVVYAIEKSPDAY
ncbi:MAG: release factor glutamine methyltransferase, partial [Actinomycetota bacterium]|nr:release factor glutamine methyltransferase [Actinomycetota bacterium]